MTQLTEISMPRLSDSMEEGTILRWLKSIGDEVALGEELVEIETDKANMVFEAPAAGTIAEIFVAEGDSIEVGAVIARLGDAETRQANRSNGDARATTGTDDEGPAVDDEPFPGADDVESSARVGAASADGSADDRKLKASPLARRIAAWAGLDLMGVPASGPGGRIVKADVQRLLGTLPSEAERAGPSQPLTSSPAPSAGAPPASGPLSSAEPGSQMPGQSAKGATEVVELTKLQQTVARRMAESKATAPHFYLQLDVDMSKCLAARATLKAKTAGGEPLPSFNDMLVKACALALRQHPRLNGSYRDGRVELHSRVNVGIAVAAQDALVVPTIFDADQKGLRVIAEEARALAQRVRDASVTPPELSGGTFTVSNLGMYGMSSIGPVINPPQAAILGAGEIRESPVVRGSQIEIGHLMKLDLACDHRVVNGAEGAEFLRLVGQILAEPLALAL
jgi:pyruvate dehydrogenase E2 component (dihydrolipoamide acetyltransferase)